MAGWAGFPVHINHLSEVISLFTALVRRAHVVSLLRLNPIFQVKSAGLRIVVGFPFTFFRFARL